MNTSIFHLEWLLNNETARSVSDLDRLSPKYAYKGHGKSFPIRMPKFSLTHQALSLYLSLSLLCSSDGSTRLSSEEFLVNCPFDNSTKNVCTFIWLESEYKQVTIYVKMCVFCELRTWIEKKLEHHTSIMIERKRLNTYF